MANIRRVPIVVAPFLSCLDAIGEYQRRGDFRVLTDQQKRVPKRLLAPTKTPEP